MLSIFKPAAHKARLPAAEIDPLYRRLRWQIFIGIFFGYAAYYLVRKNFALAMPYLIEQGFSRGDLGFALSGISIAYGFSKFIMGSVSDRSNPRIFLPALDPRRAGDAGDGLRTVGDLQHHDVRAAVPLRLVPGWAGRRAAVPWCTGGRRKSAAELFRCGTARITSAADPAAVPAGDGVV
jgi:hypothetical protein